MFTGDTAFNTAYLQPLIDLKPDVLIPCINGRFGNMNSEEAAELTSLIKPKIVIPCHFWMFKEHNGDPQSFVDTCEKLCPSVEIKLLTPGEGLVVD
jgi:L-ascorbate 6-phosphate lactonase